MSDTVYAIASGKGGVGKTTTAVNLGATLADRGNSVVVLDTDLGMANLAGFLDFEIEDPTLHEVLAGEADPEAGIYEAPGGIDVLPSSTDIEAFAKSNPAHLQGVVADLREEYDYILLDTGAGVSYDTLIPLALADVVLLVATPDVASVRDTAKTGELAARIGSAVAGAVLTKRSSDILNADDVEETLGTDVLAVIPEDEAVPMGIDAGRPLSAFAPNAPAGRAYHDLAAILDGEAVPDPELDAPAGEAAEGATPEAETPEAETPEAETADVGTDVFDLSETDAESTADPDSESVSDATPEFASESDDEGDGSGEGDESELPTEFADIIDAEETGSDPGWSEDPFADVDDAEAVDPLGSATGSTDEHGETDADSDPDADSEPDPDTDSEARSVDDLISQHIDTDRLDNENPLASVEESLDDVSDSGESDEETPATEDSTDADDTAVESADDTTESVDNAAEPTDAATSDDTAADSSEFDDPLAVGGEADESATDSTATDDADSEPSDIGAVPFKGDGQTEDVSEVERDAQSFGDDSTEETVLAEEIDDEDAADADEDTTDADDADAKDGDSGSETRDGDNSGVLGRLGSLFK